MRTCASSSRTYLSHHYASSYMICSLDEKMTIPALIVAGAKLCWAVCKNKSLCQACYLEWSSSVNCCVLIPCTLSTCTAYLKWPKYLYCNLSSGFGVSEYVEVASYDTIRQCYCNNTKWVQFVIRRRYKALILVVICTFCKWQDWKTEIVACNCDWRRLVILSYLSIRSSGRMWSRVFW